MRAATVCFLALGFSSGAYAQGLTASSIQKSLSGKRVSILCVDGTRGSGRYIMAKNFGTIQGKYQRPGADVVSDSGQVRAQGNLLCLTFKVLNGGEEQCFGVRSTGPGKFTFTVAAGLVDACQVTTIG